MKSSQRNIGSLGAIALALVCLTLVASPASASPSIDQMGLESGIEAQNSFGSRMVGMVSNWGNDFLSFLQGLGSILAGQSGSSIVD